jgi:hypothetical protein
VPTSGTPLRRTTNLCHQRPPDDISCDPTRPRRKDHAERDDLPTSQAFDLLTKWATYRSAAMTAVRAGPGASRGRMLFDIYDLSGIALAS